MSMGMSMSRKTKNMQTGGFDVWQINGLLDDVANSTTSNGAPGHFQIFGLVEKCFLYGERLAWWIC